MGFPRNDRKGNREIAGSSPFPPFYLQFTTRIVCLSLRRVHPRNVDKVYPVANREFLRDN